MRRLREFFGHTPEFKAISRGVVLGIVIGWIICELANLPSGWFFLFTVLSMGLLGLGFSAQDAMRANDGKPPVTLRTQFWRGLSEAGLGFVLTLAMEGLRLVT
jgi:hypothetical protein